MDQNLNQYKIFYTVARLGNISHAANELYISQPAISKAISKLEESLNTTLFIRNPRGVILTNEGSILFKHLQTAFDAIKTGEENIQKIHELGIGQIKIGASASFCKFLLLPYLKEFIKVYPHVKISIFSQSTIQNIKLLNADKIDIALVVKTDSISNMNFYEIGKLQDVFISTPAYLENLKTRMGNEYKEDTFNKDLFKWANFLLLDKENITRTYVDEYCLKNGINIRHILEVNNMDLLIELTKIGIGIGCVNREFVKNELSNHTIEEIELENSFASRTIGFAYKNNAASSESINKFMKIIKT